MDVLVTPLVYGNLIRPPAHEASRSCTPSNVPWVEISTAQVLSHPFPLRLQCMFLLPLMKPMERQILIVPSPLFFVKPNLSYNWELWNHVKCKTMACMHQYQRAGRKSGLLTAGTSFNHIVPSFANLESQTMRLTRNGTWKKADNDSTSSPRAK